MHPLSLLVREDVVPKSSLPIMHCSPTSLYVDSATWRVPMFFKAIVASYYNKTQGDLYDCALASAPCGSNITEGVSDNRSIFWFDVIVVYFGLASLTTFGLFGNTVNIIIFSRHSIANDSTNTLLLCISIVDLFVCVNNAVITSTFFMCFLDLSLAITSYNLVFRITFRQFAWLLLLGLDVVNVIAIQRAIAVAFPFHVAKLFTQKNTKIILLLLFAFTIITLIPNYVSSYPLWVYHPYFDKLISLGQEYRIDWVISYAYYDNYTTGRSILGLSTLIISVSYTIIKLRIQSKTRTSLKASESSRKTEGGESSASYHTMSIREKKTVKMSLAVCITTFVLYSIPTVVIGITTKLFLRSHYNKPFLVMSLNASSTFPYMMACFNFCLYLVMSREYRDIFISMVYPCRRRKG